MLSKVMSAFLPSFAKQHGMMEDVWWAWDACAHWNDDEPDEPTRAIYYDDGFDEGYIDTERFYEEFDGPTCYDWIDVPGSRFVTPLCTGRLVLHKDDPVPKVVMFIQRNTCELFEMMSPELGPTGGLALGSVEAKLDAVTPVFEPNHIREASVAARIARRTRLMLEQECFGSACELLLDPWPTTKYLDRFRNQVLHSFIDGLTDILS